MRGETFWHRGCSRLASGRATHNARPTLTLLFPPRPSSRPHASNAPRRVFDHFVVVDAAPAAETRIAAGSPFVPAVRLIVGISLLLLGFGTLSCRVDGVSERQPVVASASPWVRTVDGWERADTWGIVPVSRPPVHPLVVAAAQGLLSALALVAFQRDDVRGRSI